MKNKNMLSASFKTFKSSKNSEGRERKRMNKKVSTLALVLLLCLAGFATLVPNVLSPYDPAVLVIDTIAEPQSLDPAWVHDSASAEAILNVYETLMTFKVVYSDGPYEAGKTNQFVPLLAISVPPMESISEVSPEGLDWVQRMTFPIRTGVTFHDGGTLTPADVEYSFERLLVQDRDGGPQWRLYFPLLGMYGADMINTVTMGNMIDHAIESDATRVWFNFAQPIPDITWKQIMSQTWSSVVKKSWAIANGDFDGVFGTGSWASWHNPEVSFIEGDGMMGTGPFKFTSWIQGVSFQIDRYVGYWAGWPASIGGEIIPFDPIETVIWDYQPLWTVRRPRLLAEESVMTYVPVQYRMQLIIEDGISLYSPLDALAVDAFFFTFNITATSPWVGTVDPVHRYGGDPLFPWGPDRIPLDLFSDINVRKGFAHIFDYDIWHTGSGGGTQPSDPIISGVTYDNPAQQKYHYDLAEAEYYLKLAWGGTGANPDHNPALVTPGALWNNGMSFQVLYNTGNIGRMQAAEMFQNYVNSLNPSKFVLTATNVPWSSVYLPDMVASKLPLFMNGWTADFTDPDDFAFPFMHSQGTFAASQKYSNPHVDELIEAGATTPDGPSNPAFQVPDPITTFGWGTTTSGAIPPDADYARQSIYYKLQDIYYQDVPSVSFFKPLGRHWQRDSLHGWYYNPIEGGSMSPGIDSSTPTKPRVCWLTKKTHSTHPADINNDGWVDMGDVGLISAHWYIPGWSWQGPLGYSIFVDINGGCDPNGNLVVGLPDGIIDIVDLGMVSAWWCGPPRGPLHP